MKSLAEIILIFLSLTTTIDNVVGTIDATEISLIEPINDLKDQISKTAQLLVQDYSKLTENDTTILSNWKAYSRILSKINYVLFDMISEALMDSDLVDSLSDGCVKSLTDFSIALVQQESWSYQIIDSNGFLSSGLLKGSFANFGDFDECIGAGLDHKDHLARYCLINYHIDFETNQTNLFAQDLIFNTTGTILERTFFTELLRYAHFFKARQGRSGLCVPSACTKDDVQLLIDNVLRIDKLIFNVSSCQTNDGLYRFSLLQIIILCLFVAISLIIIALTIIEFTFHSDDDVKSRSSILLRKLSIKQNFQSLLTIEGSADQLSSINGIRLLTMFWLVYSHVYLLSVKETFRSSTRFIESLFDFKVHLIINAWPAVDIFFILSALLHSYHVFQLLRVKEEINVLRIVCNRIARLWPSLWFIVGLVFVIPSFGRGPLWPEIMSQQVSSCYDHWWKVVTFTANFRYDNNYCQIHTWYLSADFQLFLLSFIFIFLIFKYHKRAILMLSLSNLILSCCVTIYFYLKKLHPTILFTQIDEKKIYDEIFTIYMPTYLHLSPYLIGIFTGYFIVISRETSFRFPKALNYLWLLSILSMLTIILFGYFFTSYPQIPVIIQSLYAGFHRLLWSVSIAFIILYCEINHNGFVRDFLGHKIFASLSRLSYLIYLVHFVITWTRFANARQPLIFSHSTMFNEFIINLFYTICVSIVVYLIVEAPFSNIYSLYVGKREWPIGNFSLRSKFLTKNRTLKDRKIDQEESVEMS
ncbi:Innexin inx2 [Sarcoptes scabiei]|nr:Innexin inx2 [Sarcoptes scabiei]